MQQPPIVIECPVCGEKYLISRYAKLPSADAICFSDGYFTDVHNWRTPEIIGCITCDLGFFPHEGKLVAEPNWEEYNELWAHLYKAEPPTAGSIALDLRARKDFTIEIEIPIRTEFWYAANHTETGRILLLKNEKFRSFWFDSLMRLQKIIPANIESSVILKAEINRQLGLYDRCLELISESTDPLAIQIIQHAKMGINEVFEFSNP